MGALRGKTALVTGGGRGIGRAIAERLAEEGARVGVHYAHDERAAAETVAAITGDDGEAFAIRADLADPDAAPRLRDALAAHSDHLDILINNAGIGDVRTPIAEVTAARLDRLFAALEPLTVALARELGGRGITANTVAPGVVDTDLNADWLASAQARSFVAASSPLNRVAVPDDVAGVVAFLVSPAGRWVTGQRIEAAGGAGL